MKEIDNYHRVMSELKKCKANQVNKLASEATNIFPILTKAEQRETTNEFLSWAEKIKVHHPLKYAWSKFFDGWTDFLFENYESALSKMAEVKQLFTDMNESSGIACSLAVMAGTYWTLGNSNLTLKLGMEAQRILIPLGLFEHFLTASNYVLGIISFESGNDAEAKKYLENALEQAE